VTVDDESAQVSENIELKQSDATLNKEGTNEKYLNINRGEWYQISAKMTLETIATFYVMVITKCINMSFFL